MTSCGCCSMGIQANTENTITESLRLGTANGIQTAKRKGIESEEPQTILHTDDNGAIVLTTKMKTVFILFKKSVNVSKKKKSIQKKVSFFSYVPAAVQTET